MRAVRWARTIATRMVSALLSPIALGLLLAGAALARPGTLRRQRGGGRPRLVYGPVPLLNIKYMSEAVRRLGYEARTVVHQVYHINARSDFDYCYDDFFRTRVLAGSGALRSQLRRYAIFLWLLFRFDVFHINFSGGFLEGTPLRFMEAQLLHVAGKKLIVMPYGADVLDLRHTRSLVFRHTMIAQYPHMVAYQSQVARQLRYFTKYADFIIGTGCFIESMTRWDMLVTHYYPIDTDLWKFCLRESQGDGRRGEVVVLHSPNHRLVKGTEFLMAACEELQREGYRVRVVLAENVPNAEVRRLMEQCDIVAEQFAMPWYGLNAMEAMSMGRPVLSDLSEEYYTQVFWRYTGLDECPILNTPPTRLKENLKRLVESPQLRQAGRTYVLRYHSYAAMGRMWEAIYRRVWKGEKIELHAWHPGREVKDLLKDGPVWSDEGRS